MSKKKIPLGSFFQIRFSPVEHKELVYIAKHRGIVWTKQGKNVVNKGEAVRVLIREEAARIREERRRAKR